MVGSAKATSACLDLTNPNPIANKGISKAVMVTCSASVSQSTATKTNKASPLLASGVKGKTFNKIKKRTTSAIKMRLLRKFELLVGALVVIRASHKNKLNGNILRKSGNLNKNVINL